MFKYYLIGKVYKENYEIYLMSYYYTSYIYNTLSENRTSYELSSLEKINIMDILKESINDKCSYYETSPWNWCKYDNELDYKEKHKIQKRSMHNVDTFDRYEEFDCIETDREFRDNEIIKIDEQDYTIEYKYNKELNRHELYLDYTIRTEVDEKLKKDCKDKICETNNQIEKYNKTIDDSEVTIDKRFKNYIKPEDKPTPPPAKVVYEDGGILNKVKSWFTRNTNNTN